MQCNFISDLLCRCWSLARVPQGAGVSLGTSRSHQELPLGPALGQRDLEVPPASAPLWFCGSVHFQHAENSAGILLLHFW